MLWIVSGIIAIVLCVIGMLSRTERLKKLLFTAVIVVEIIPLTISVIGLINHNKDTTGTDDNLKYFKCSRCGEITTATDKEYQYDAAHKTYYLMHDCPMYVSDMRMDEVDKKDALEELKLKNNNKQSTTK